MNSEFSPLVSIIIPVYNGANYMREAIDSALRQTYKNIEVIVVNDGSNDNGETEKIALSYGDRIRYLRKENGGVSSALNLGIHEMRGEYFSWLSHDDMYAPKKIESQISAIGRYQDKSVVSLCGTRQINKESEFISKMKKVQFKPYTLINANEVLFELFDSGCFCGCALLIPRKAFDTVGMFHEDLRFCQDYLKWIQIFLNGYFLIYNDDPYVYSRVHNKQLTQTGKELFHKDSEVICDIVMSEIIGKSTVKNNLLYAFAINNAKYSNVAPAQKMLMKAKEAELLSPLQELKVKIILKYGKIRPYIRKAYYKLLKHV